MAMATPKLILFHLRRSRPLYNSLSHLLSNHPHHNLVPRHLHSLNSFSAFHFSSARSFSSPSNNSSGFVENSVTESSAHSEFINHAAITDGVIGGGGGSSCGEDSILPVRALISLLDAYHNLTGLPWWIIIVSSTVAMRITLFPLLILQLHKLKRISELFPKLPPPFPRPLSGKSYIDQFSIFQKERRAIGCPSYLWFLASFSVQVPCFFLWVTSIRKMSLNHHLGFDSGGILWFQNLTEYPHGVLGPIFPTLIAILHYLNVQLSFERSSLQKMTGLLGLLARYYKLYLDLLTLPLFFIGYCIPQGSLVYWVTNSSLSAIQQLSLKHPAVCAKLGLPDKDCPTTPANSEQVVAPGIASSDLPGKEFNVPVENLSTKQLVAISVQLISNGHKDKAFLLLKLALEKDPDYVNALILMGQAFLRKELYAEAIEYLERAISKLLHTEHPTEAKDVDILIVASQWAGVACIRQGKNAEGILHLERIASSKEPEDPNSKVHYFNSLIFLGSALLNEGRKAEAIKYIRLVVAYNPAYRGLLEQCENDGDNFFNDLVSSRRGDY